MSISIRGVSKRFDRFLALDGVDLEVRSGELLALLGPSGSGKTTLLRIIAGLERPDQQGGSVWMQGADVGHLAVRKRGVGFVFQHYALFRHMTVAQNIAFGLSVQPRAQRASKQAIQARVESLLALIQMEGYAQHHPDQLSGGQRQRVALARALAVEPEVLLLDEPFGALDARVRAELRRWLRELHRELHVTSVFVTHDQEEAMEVADRIVVMNQGRIEQIGTPDEVYQHPRSEFVLQFFGQVNRFAGHLRSGQLELCGGTWGLPVAGDRPVAVYVRPHEFSAVAPGTPGGILATVERSTCLAAQRRVELTSAHGERLQFCTPALASAPAPGSQLTLLPRVLRLYLDGLPLEVRDGEPHSARPATVLG